jgi:hypothetical protein
MENTDARRVKNCHINGKLCIDGIRSDFENDPATGRPAGCRQWVHLFGKDPQSEKVIDQFDCSFAWVPVTTIEGAQMSRQTAASVDKVANQVAEVKQGVVAMGGAVRVAAANISQAIEAGAMTVMLPPPSSGPETNGHEERDIKG